MTDWAAESMGIYEDLKAEGFELTVRVPGSEGEWNPESMAWGDGDSDTDYTTYGLKKSYSIKDIDGTVIQQGDTRLIFSAYGLDSSGDLVDLPDLSTSNKILIDSEEQNIIDLSPVEPGNVVIMYEAQIR